MGERGHLRILKNQNHLNVAREKEEGWWGPPKTPLQCEGTRIRGGAKDSGKGKGGRKRGCKMRGG